jgi:putative ABC transport system permease protein
MANLGEDLRAAFRLFWSRAGFAWAVIVTIALATGFLGVTTSLATALTTPRVARIGDPSRVVAFYRTDASNQFAPASIAELDIITTALPEIESAAAVDAGTSVMLGVRESWITVRAGMVRGELFETLGVTVRKLFAPAVPIAGDARKPTPRILIGERLAQRIFPGGIDGREQLVRVNGRAHAVVGIVPADFTGLRIGSAIDLWTIDPPARTSASDAAEIVTVVGRLRAAATFDDVVRRLAVLPGPALTVVPFDRIDPVYRAAARPIALVLVVAGVMVLAAACTNLATLAMSHYTTRLAEFAIRASVGGTPHRLSRQLATEGIVLAFGACVLTGVAAFWSRQLLFAWLSPEQAAAVEWRSGVAEIALPVTASFMACAIVFALCARRGSGLGLPLLSSIGRDLSRAARGERPHSALVVVQVAVACCLVVAMVLVHGALQKAMESGAGTVADHVAVVSTFAPTRYADKARGARFQHSALERVALAPGVTSAAWTSTLPLVSASQAGYTRDLAAGYANYRTVIVSSGYFTTMKHDIVEGREFTSRDDRIDTGAVVVNTAFAQRVFPDGAIGGTLFGDDRGRMTIVGVAADARYRKMEDHPEPTVYLPMSKRYLAGFHLVVRTAGPAAPVVGDIADLLRAIDSVEIDRETTLARHLQTAVKRDRVAEVTVLASGLLIVGFAMTGPFLLTRHAVTSRSDELAIRLAFGARGKHIVGLALSHALRASLVGIVLGEAAAISLAVFVAPSTGIAPGAVTSTFVWTGLALTGTCAVAAFVPALGACFVRPMAALR